MTRSLMNRGRVVCWAMAGLASAMLASQALALPRYGAYVTGGGTDQGDGSYKFEYTLVNATTPGGGIGVSSIEPESALLTVGWMLPLFSPTDVRDITSPAGWVGEILSASEVTGVYNNASGIYGNFGWDDYELTADPDYQANPGVYGSNPSVFENAPYVVHWYVAPDTGDQPSAEALSPLESANGFGFTADAAGTSAPFLSTWYILPPRPRDPSAPGSVYEFAIPNTQALQDARDGVSNAVPEPVTAAGFGFAAVAAGLAALRRRTLR